MEQQLSLFGFEEQPSVPAAAKEAMAPPTSQEQDAAPVDPKPIDDTIQREKVVQETEILPVIPSSITVIMPPSEEVDFVATNTLTPAANAPVPLEELSAEKEVHLSIEKEEKTETIAENISSEKVHTATKRGRKSFKDIDAEVDLIQVPKEEQLYKKQYYSISQVAKWFRVNNSLLRFWENEFDILKPRKNRKGDRLFRPEDIKNLQIIYYLLRQKKYTIDGARKYLKENRKNIDMQLQLVQTLNDFKGFLLELKANAE